VAEFARTFKQQIPLVRARLGEVPSDRVLYGLCNALSNAGLHMHMLILLTREGRQELKNIRRRKKIRSSWQRQRNQQQQEEHTSSTEEERSDAEEQSDPVSAAVDFLLGLMGM